MIEARTCIADYVILSSIFFLPTLVKMGSSNPPLLLVKRVGSRSGSTFCRSWVQYFCKWYQLATLICNSNSFYSFILKLFIRIGLQKRFQNFKQRASKGIQIGSVVFVAIFSWRKELKKYRPPDKNAYDN